MINRRHRDILIILVLFLCFIMSSLVLAADNGNTRASLRGLGGVYILVESLLPEIERNGLTKHRIGADVESNLHRAGIKTISREDWLDVPGNPFLYVNAHVLRLRSTKEYIYSINIALKQNVYPVREPIEILEAATWSLGTITGITGNLEKIRTSVRGQVDKFIKAYLSVNPK